MTLKENAEQARRAFRSRSLILDNFPTQLTMESTAICNLRCVMCPQAIGAVDRPKHMPLDTFKKMKEPMAHASRVGLHGIGEPLASPVFWHALENDYFDLDSEIVTNTNMTLLDERRLKRLVKTKFKLLLNISLDAATSLTYGRIRGADFQEIVGNIRALRAARGARSYPIILLNMTLMRANIEEAVLFVELAKQLDADGVCFWHLNRLPDAAMAEYSLNREDWHFEYAE